MSEKTPRHVIIPGLFDKLEVWQADFNFLPEANSLSKTLATYKRGKTNAEGYLATLYHLLGEQSNNSGTGHAHNCYHFDFGTQPEKAVLCAMPIQLDAGLNDIAIDHTAVDDLSDEEQKILLKELNNHFSQDGWEFVISDQGNWYLLLPENDLPDSTIPLELALGASLRDLLEGKEQVQWSRQLNELQMLLHASQVNRNREMLRKRPVSSLWLWNVDSTKCANIQNKIRFVAGGDYEGQVLAKRHQVDWIELTQATDNNEAGVYIVDDLIVPARMNNLEVWQEKLTLLEPFLMDLLDDEVNDTTVYSSNGYFWHSARKWSWNNLFNRKKSLLDLL